MDKAALIRASWAGWMSQAARPAGPPWWQLGWTALFATGVALGLAVLDFGLSAGRATAWPSAGELAGLYARCLVVSLAIGYSIHALFALGRRAWGRRGPQGAAAWQRRLYFGGVPMAGTLLGAVLGVRLLGGDPRVLWTTLSAPAAAGALALGLLIWLLSGAYFGARHKRLQAERRAAQAQLRLLQAQMEPHFLFNTLANVVSLIEADPPRARQMLESFTDYLRASLAPFAQATHTLGDELGLIEAYLRVVQLRMEDRLRYAIDVEPALRTLRIPALTLQPLVENAVVHGVAPQVDGGQVRVGARLRGHRLVLQVQDDGVGLGGARAHSASGAGTALSNLRQRLAQWCDEPAPLEIAAVPSGGVLATLTLPIRRDAA